MHHLEKRQNFMEDDKKSPKERNDVSEGNYGNSIPYSEQTLSSVSMFDVSNSAEVYGLQILEH